MDGKPITENSDEEQRIKKTWKEAELLKEEKKTTQEQETINSENVISR